MKILKINIAKYTSEELQVISDELNINYDWLLKAKIDCDVCDYFIDMDTFLIFAWTTNEEKDKIQYSMKDLNGVMNTAPLCDIIEKNENKEKFNIDDILDKISTFGMDSLIKEELNFLTKQ